MTLYITKDDRPGILFTKRDGRDMLAANQPSLLDGRETEIGCNHLHTFAVRPDELGCIRVALDAGGDSDFDLWMSPDEAQELVDALRIGIASARAAAARRG